MREAASGLAAGDSIIFLADQVAEESHGDCRDGGRRRTFRAIFGATEAQHARGRLATRVTGSWNLIEFSRSRIPLAARGEQRLIRARPRNLLFKFSFSRPTSATATAAGSMRFRFSAPSLAVACSRHMFDANSSSGEEKSSNVGWIIYERTIASSCGLVELLHLIERRN